MPLYDDGLQFVSDVLQDSGKLILLQRYPQTNTLLLLPFTAQWGVKLVTKNRIVMPRWHRSKEINITAYETNLLNNGQLKLECQ